MLNIADPKEASLIRKLLTKFNSVTITKPARKRKTGIEEALEDVEAGNLTKYESTDDMFNKLGIKI